LGALSRCLYSAAYIIGTFGSNSRQGQRSLLPGLRAAKGADARKFVFSELDYGFYKVRADLGVGPSDARCYMIRTGRWKYIHYKGFRPQLFDLENDPLEFEDLGASSAHASVLAEMHGLLTDRLLDRRNRVTLDDEQVVQRGLNVKASGVLIGKW
jgi:arylsulfatase A-like enzyme